METSKPVNTNENFPLLETNESRVNGVNPPPPLAAPEVIELEGSTSDEENNFSDNKNRDFIDGEIPMIFSRAGGDGEDQPDGVSKQPSDENNASVRPPEKHGLFPYAPSYGHDLEIGSTMAELDSLPDVNVYQHKKTLAQGMMDLALFSANANQLRYVIESFSRHPYYYPSIVFISLSLILQVAIGIGLIWNATYNVKDEKEICIANKINNFTVIGIFLVTIINVFISAFGVATPS